MKIAGGVLIGFLLLIPAFAWADDAVYHYPFADCLRGDDSGHSAELEAGAQW